MNLTARAYGLMVSLVGERILIDGLEPPVAIWPDGLGIVDNEDAIAWLATFGCSLTPVRTMHFDGFDAANHTGSIDGEPVTVRVTVLTSEPVAVPA